MYIYIYLYFYSSYNCFVCFYAAMSSFVLQPFIQARWCWSPWAVWLWSIVGMLLNTSDLTTGALRCMLNTGDEDKDLGPVTFKPFQVVVSHFFFWNFYTETWGDDSIWLAHIFQMRGGNHQQVCSIVFWAGNQNDFGGSHGMLRHTHMRGYAWMIRVKTYLVGSSGIPFSQLYNYIIYKNIQHVFMFNH